MAFWSSEKLKERIPTEELIYPYAEKCIEHAAYELGLGPEAFITSDGEEKKIILAVGQQLVIPEGQFGLLLTEEVVTVPLNAIGFISIKASIKFRGLVNVSGFHVDPGFKGRLKFSVYNAGSHAIVLDRNQRVFLLWLSDLDKTTNDGYKGQHFKQGNINSADVMRIHGGVASPGALKERIDDLKNDYDKRLAAVETRVTVWQGVTIAFLVAIAMLVIKAFWDGRVPSEPTTATRPSAGQNSSEEPLLPVVPNTPTGDPNPATTENIGKTTPQQ